MTVILIFIGGILIAFAIGVLSKTKITVPPKGAPFIDIDNNPVELAFFRGGTDLSYKVILVNLVLRKYLLPSRNKEKFKLKPHQFEADSTSPYSEEVHRYLKHITANNREITSYRTLYSNEAEKGLFKLLGNLNNRLEESGLIFSAATISNMQYYKFVGILILSTSIVFSLLLTTSFGSAFLLILAGPFALFLFNKFMSYDRVTEEGYKVLEEIELRTKKFKKAYSNSDVDNHLRYLVACREDETLWNRYDYL